MKKRITPASAKDKGRRLQQWVCRQISNLTGYEWGSSGEDKPIESRPMGQRGVDVRMESQVKQLFPFSVECKSQESWGVHAWIKQAIENQTPGTDWLIVAKRSRQKPVIIMDAERFFEIYGEKRHQKIQRTKSPGQIQDSRKSSIHK